MTDHQVGVLLLDFALIVILAKLAGRVARLLRQPAVIGEIVAGILVGPSLFHGHIAQTLFPTDVRPFLAPLANLGVVLFMFIVGLELDYTKLRGSGRVAGVTALGSTVVPFGLGALLAVYLIGQHQTANRLGFILFMGVVMAVTAFPVLARIIADRNMGQTLIGALALSVAAFCDIAAWSFLALVQIVAGNGNGTHWFILLVIPYLALMFVVVRPLLRRLLAGDRSGAPLSGSRFAIVVTGLLLSAAMTQLLALHFIFGAFVFGLVMPRGGTAGLRDALLHRTEFATTMLLPVYFVVAGLNVDLSHIDGAGLVELGLIMVTAVASKLGGTFLGARTQGLSHHQSALLATLMNTRGLTELIALGVGLQIGVIDKKLYSLMVVMAVVTTTMTGPLLHWLSRRGPIEHDQGVPLVASRGGSGTAG